MFSRASKNIQHFLLEAQSAQQVALTRIILCGTLFFLACSRQLNMDQYGLNSMIPRSEALSVYPEFYRPALQYFFWPDSWASGVHLILIGLLLLATLGLSNRVLMLLTWVISQGFINRNYSMLFGADLIGALFLFYLSFTNCQDHFSLRKKIKKRSELSRQVSSVFFRLFQLQLMVIYAYTGLEKLKGSTWWDGTALWTVFANPQFIVADFTFLRHFPWIFALGTFVTLIFEIYFPAMMLFKPGRQIWLILGVSFHLGIGLLLNLMPFSLVMLAAYFLFLETSLIEKGAQRLRLKMKRS